MNLFIAKLKNMTGRFLLYEVDGGFEGRKIHSAARQQRYGNRPDPETGLYLNEMQFYVSLSDIASLKPWRATS